MSNVQPFDYIESRQDADELIAEFGQAGAIRVPGQPSGDPWNPTPGQFVDHPCTLVVLEYSARDLEGTSILSTDKRILVAAGTSEIAPAQAMQLVVGDRAFNIIRVETLAPAGIVVLYDCQVRA